MNLRSSLFIALLGLGAVAAPASAGTVSVSTTGTSVVVSSTGGSDLTIRPEEGRVGIISFKGDTLSTSSSSCTADPQDTSIILCDMRPDLQMGFDGGNDEVRLITLCFATATLNMGDGTNSYSGEGSPSCPVGAVTVNGGSGQDSFSGSSETGVVTKETLSGGAGDDGLTGAGGDDALRGGDGVDSVSGGAGNDTVLGEGGIDTLFGSAGDDTIDGGDGDDKLGVGLSGDDDQGADDVRGGAGTDVLDLHGHTGGMSISLDDVRNDGAPGENDNLHTDIESIRGTAANDTYTGSPGPNEFDGDSGVDVVRGGDGSDILFGGSDGDQVFGDGGADTLYGSSGDDVVDGGAGTDSLFGDFSSCSQTACAGGNDQLRGRDGEVDQINCGAGADIATIDMRDVAALDGFQACESVDRAGGPTGGGPGANTTAPAFTFSTTGTLSRAKGLKVKLTCPGPCSYTMTLALGAKTARKAGLGRKAITIGRLRGSLLKAGSKTVTLKLSKRARTKLRRSRTVTASLKLAVTDPAGKAVRKQKTVKLKR